MFLFNMLERHTNWNNRDYRDYRDHRTRLKRRLRFRLSIGLTLLVVVALVDYLGVQRRLAPMATATAGQSAPSTATFPAQGVLIRNHMPAAAGTEQGRRQGQTDAGPDLFMPGPGQ